MKITRFFIFGNFEFHLVYWLKRGQRPNQNLNNFTFYDRAINFTSDGENLIASCYL